MYKTGDAALAQRRENVKNIAARRRAETHCSRGHLITGVRSDNGRRFCRVCANDRTISWRHWKKRQ